MPKKKVKRARSVRKEETWFGFSTTQIIIVFSVFIIFAVFYMM